MKLFEQQDHQGLKRKSKTPKILRRMKNKRERAQAKRDPEAAPTYRSYKGWAT